MYILVLLAVLVGSTSQVEYSEKALTARLEQGIGEFQSTRTFPAYLNETLQHLQHPFFFRYYDDVNYRRSLKLKASTTCTVCYAVANLLISERRIGASENIIALEAEAFCTLLGIEKAEVCTGIIELNLPIFIHLVDNNKDLKGQRICDLILQNNGCNSTTFEWTIEIPEGKTVEKKNQSVSESTFNILHISDYHFDPSYTEGKVKSCDVPLCCQSDQANGSFADGTACGHWSEFYNADSSEALVDETHRYANNFEFDYVYFTGDIISHRVWSTSVEDNRKDMKTLFRKMKKAFPGKPIYTALGNHEPSPLNEYAIGVNATNNLTTSWLYRLITTEFSQFLPKSAKRELMKGGYYSVSPKAGFRVIVLNSNVAYTMNWWLAQNDTDPLNQLTWLVDTLQAAEDNDEIVHIIAHIPGGKSDLMKVWSREYHKIIERFANTIAAQFNGHTHKDQFMVYYSSSNTSEAISIATNGASVTTDASNPSFKVINIDSSNYDIIDTHEYTFNLTEANLNGSSTPNWYKLYSFRESYGVKSLAAYEFSELMPRMATNHSLLSNYHTYRYRNSDVSIASGCDNQCKKDYLCEIATSQVGDSTQCDLLVKIFNENV